MKTVLLLFPAALLFAACESTAPDSGSNAPESAAERFARADVNKDGALTPQEISQAVDARMFAARDANRDGVLTAGECTPAELAGHTAADKNKDGKVTLAEFSAHAARAADRNAGFKEADANGDGVLNEAEAEAYYASKE